MDSDDDIEVGDFIPDVGAEETVVSLDIIQQRIVDKLEAAQNHKFEDLAAQISSGFEKLANIFTVMMPNLAGPQRERPQWVMMHNPMSLCRNSPGLMSNLAVFPHVQLRSLLLSLK